MSIESGCPMSRRRLFGAAGATAAGALLSTPGPAKATTRSQESGLVHTMVRSDRFGRLFDLKPFAEPSPKVIAALKALGAPGGPMDVGDDLASGPLNLILNPGANRDNPTHTAGMTFVGQFIDHDLTLDATSPLATPTRPEATINRRSPAFDLDSVYGSGPFGDPLLYEADRMRLKVGARGAFEDVPRLPDGTALIGDSRNDENLAVNGIHAAFLAFHNKVIETRRGQQLPRRSPDRHLALAVAGVATSSCPRRSAASRRCSRDRRLWRGIRTPFIPVEFQGAAYRFGHSQVRPSYRVNFTGAADGGQRFAFVFDPSQRDVARPERHAGRDRRAGTPHRVADVLPLRRRPRPVHAAEQADRHQALLPALPPPAQDGARPGGRALARPAQPAAPPDVEPALRPGDREGARRCRCSPPTSSRSSPRSTRRSRAPRRSGTTSSRRRRSAAATRLGPLGSVLVGGVILGLMLADPNAYLNAAPGWRPTLGRTRGQFTMTDLLDYAGVGAVR